MAPPARLRFASVAAVLAACAPAPVAADSPSDERRPVAATARFAFHSDLDTNLEDALAAAGEARSRGRPEPFDAGAEGVCFRELPAWQRAAWTQTVGYYAEAISPATHFDDARVVPRLDLAGFDDEISAGDRAFAEATAHLRSAARPAWTACAWRDLHRANRRWILSLVERLEQRETAIAARLAEVYATSWPEARLPVDVVGTVDWSGANTMFIGPAGHILIAGRDPRYQGPAALEMVFHEASHLLMGRRSPVRAALAEAAARTGIAQPDQLWHALLFFTTGEVVREVLAATGTEYRPFAEVEGIWRGDWGAYHRALEEAWRPYLAGERALEEAAAALLRSLSLSS